MEWQGQIWRPRITEEAAAVIQAAAMGVGQRNEHIQDQFLNLQGSVIYEM